MIPALKLHCWEGYGSERIITPFREKWRGNVEIENLLSNAAAVQHCEIKGNLQPDVLNINNAYIAKYLAPRGLVNQLDSSHP